MMWVELNKEESSVILNQLFDLEPLYLGDDSDFGNSIYIIDSIKYLVESSVFNHSTKVFQYQNQDSFF